MEVTETDRGHPIIAVCQRSALFEQRPTSKRLLQELQL